MNELTVFNFEKNDIRVVDVDGKPWFVAKDVAMILGYADAAQAVRDNCKYAKSLNSLTSVSQTEANKINALPGNALLIPESDLYRLTIKSKLPAAERFEIFVMEVLLPQLRKEGRYELKTQNSLEVTAWADKIVLVL